MNDILNQINKMNYRDIEDNDLGRSSVVTLEKDRVCFKCKKMMPRGRQAICSSSLIDSNYNISYKELLFNDFADTDNFNFKKVRHWICMDCASSIIQRHSKTRCKLA